MSRPSHLCLHLVGSPSPRLGGPIFGVPPGATPSMGRIVHVPFPQQIAVTLYHYGLGVEHLDAQPRLLTELPSQHQSAPFRGVHALHKRRVLDHHLRAGVFYTGQSAEGFLRRAAHCERLAEEMGDPLPAEAFRRLASQWCDAADYVAD